MKRWLSICLLFLYLPFCYGAGMELHRCADRQCKEAGSPARTASNESCETGQPAREHVEQQLEMQWVLKGKATVLQPAVPALFTSPVISPAEAMPRTYRMQAISGVPLYIRHCVYRL